MRKDEQTLPLLKRDKSFRLVFDLLSSFFEHKLKCFLIVFPVRNFEIIQFLGRKRDAVLPLAAWSSSVRHRRIPSLVQRPVRLQECARSHRLVIVIGGTGSTISTSRIRLALRRFTEDDVDRRLPVGSFRWRRRADPFSISRVVLAVVDFRRGLVHRFVRHGDYTTVCCCRFLPIQIGFLLEWQRFLLTFFQSCAHVSCSCSPALTRMQRSKIQIP